MTKFPITIFGHEITNATEANSWIGTLHVSILALEAAIRNSSADPEIQSIADMLNSRILAGEVLACRTGEHFSAFSKVDSIWFCPTKKGQELTYRYIGEDWNSYDHSTIDEVRKLNLDGPPELIYQRHDENTTENKNES